MSHSSSGIGRSADVVSLWLWTFASGSFALGTLLSESFSERMLFGRYSSSWFAVICLSVLGFGALATMAVRRMRTRSDPGDRRPASRYRLLLALAAASWGASLLTQYRVDPGQISHLFAGEFFGATQPAGVALEYLAQSFVILAGLARLLTYAARVRRSRVHLSRVSVLIAGLLASYLIAEGSIRALNVVRPQSQDEPTKASRMWNARYASLNSQGYRDREFEPRTAVPPQLRILVIGDSFTYGIGIRDPRDRFTGVLETCLRAQPSSAPARVFNAGVPGTDSADDLRLLNRLLSLDPDLVLIEYTFNDIDHVLHRALPPTFSPQSYLARFSSHRLLMLNSHLFDQLLLRYRAYQHRDSRDIYLAAYADPDLLRRHLDVLARLVQTAAAAGVPLQIVPVDMAVRLGPTYEGRYQHFVQAVRDRGMPVWRVDHLFTGFAYKALIVSTWDHHPNERAHRLLGEFLCEKIRDEWAMGHRWRGGGATWRLRGEMR